MCAVRRANRFHAHTRIRLCLMGGCVGVGTATFAYAKPDPTDDDLTTRNDLHACFTWTDNQARGCPSVASIQSAVEGLLGRSTFYGDRCDVRISGTIHRSKEHATVVDLQFRTDAGVDLGQRRLEGNHPKCSTYSGPISLVIALMLESVELGATVTETKEPAETIEPIPQRRPAPSPNPSAPNPLASEEPPSEPVEARSAFAIMADARGAWGLLPKPSFGLGVALEVTPKGWLPMRGDAAIWFPSQSEPPGPGGRFWGWQAGIGAVPFTHTGLVGTQLLADLSFGFLYGKGLKLDSAQQSRRPFGTFALRLANSIHLMGPLELVARIGLAIPWLRPNFVYTDETDAAIRVHRPEFLIGEVGLGLSMDLGARRKKRLGAP